ncbi:putative permease [Gordonia polyisoprenivorans VH2]|uniref:Putative permease n=1 Tax=Gordonia polyisoprenivorans (strain DSM 44266 / VH2) TaxID=1112204 RepID=H6MQZ7_GORPV|nr:cytosine permease [Gordonia polyisoprenivorans]AFA73694.1 putative permease [Gordonia polyisoprenivorans VH2]HCS59257.1 purine/cytosine permease [Gordonia polyisoprenivorans]
MTPAPSEPDQPDGAEVIADPTDRVGRIEESGVDYLPESQRDSNPRNVFAVFAGGNLGWTIAVFGWVSIQLGLDFWGAVISTVVGTLIGTVVVLPLAGVSPRTGTNMTVSSGAFFGIRGRLIGSALSLVIAIVFAAITVWTSGDALVAAAHRLVGLPQNPVMLGVGYAVVSVVIVAVALFGHATIVAMQKFLVPVAAAVFVLGFVAFAPTFDVHSATGHFAVGGYWSTMVLSTVLATAGPISYAPIIGDYTRRISIKRHSDSSIRWALFAGLMFGTLLPAVLGAFAGSAMTVNSGEFMADLVSSSPFWFLIPILIVSIAGGFGQGVMCIYATGLDLETFFPRLKRVHTTALAAAVAVALLYVGVFVLDAVDAITAATVVVNAVATPWAVVMVVGALRTRTYDPYDLQAFAQGRRGGRYWFVRGWNPAAVAAWVGGSAFGLLSVQTDLYSGPLADIFGGIDPSAIGSGVVAAIIYLGLVMMSRQRMEVLDAPALATPAGPEPA